MNIRYLGHSCFLITGSFSVVTDPFSDIGYTQETVKADYCLISHDHFDHNAAKNVRGAIVVDKNSGVSVAKNIGVEQIFTFHDEFNGSKRGYNIVHKFSLDNVTFCHMGDIGERYSDETARRIGGCDVLFIPVGGNYTVDCLTAKRFVDAISPKIVVPMHFKTPRSRIDIDGVEGFRSLYKSIIEAENDFSFDSAALSDIKETVCLSFDTKKF